MIKEPFFPFFCLCSFLIHTALSVSIILNPLKNVWAKKNTLKGQTVQISSIDSSTLLNLKTKNNQELPLKKISGSPPAKSVETAKKPVPKAPLPDPLKKAQKQAKKKGKKINKKESKSQKTLKKNQVLKNIQQKQKHAMEKLSALESLEKIKQELAEQNAEQSQGTALPTAKAPMGGKQVGDFQTLQYFAGLKAHINMYWNLPQELAGKNLRTEVYAEIDKTGRILKGQILQSSGNEDFDARVLETINRASPFPPPPTEEIEKLLLKGIVFNFPK